MREMAMELQEIQKEVANVRKSLQENGSYLGMAGETLQRYFLTLNEKENLCLSRQLQAAANSNGGSGHRAAEKPALVARELPAGDPATFDRESLSGVCSHMVSYEASPTESGKALRALASLAYESASKVGENPDALPQVIRLLELHPEEQHVQLNGMRALCNIAYDATLALEKLSTREVIGVVVKSIIQMKDNKEKCAKAQETIARVVAAEVGPENGPAPNVPIERSPLCALFTVLGPEAGDEGRIVVIELLEQLVTNEVATTDFLAQRFVASAGPLKEDSSAATAWLMLAKVLAMKELLDFSDHLVSRDAIPAAQTLMTAQVSSTKAQLAGIEAMSGLVGSRWPGLQSFAKVSGISNIERAMTTHPDEGVLQTKGIRAMASGIQWPEDIQKKAGYDYKSGVKLTKTAMAKHAENEELVTAGMEALYKYLEKTKCIEEVKSEGGVGQIKALMMKYAENKKIKAMGSQILESLGEAGWQPKAGYS